MRKEKWVWFDMDGTIADFYGVDGWLESLINHDVKPYREAKPLYAIKELVNIMIALKENGYNIGIISWSSKDHNPAFDREVKLAKEEWLTKNFLDLLLDKVIVTPYGVKKSDTCRKYGYGVLVDDEKQNRDNWDLGATIDASQNILEALKRVLAM